jgi:hypothetical protein
MLFIASYGHPIAYLPFQFLLSLSAYQSTLLLKKAEEKKLRSLVLGQTLGASFNNYFPKDIETPI